MNKVDLPLSDGSGQPEDEQRMYVTPDVGEAGFDRGAVCLAGKA
jgi:hypothetical protein